MAASTRSNPAKLLLVAGLALLTGCGSCVDDPNAQSSQGGSVGPGAARFSRTETTEDVARPRPYLTDAQAP